MRPGCRLMDGVARNEAHPDTFQIPTQEERDGLRPGAFAKIGIEMPDGAGERFWVKVEGRAEGENAGRYRGAISNDLVHTRDHGMKDADTIEFGPEHVLAVYGD